MTYKKTVLAYEIQCQTSFSAEIKTKGTCYRHWNYNIQLNIWIFLASYTQVWL